MYHVYILYCHAHDLYYKGYTENLSIRLIEHNEGLSRYTSGKGPWELVYQKMFETKREALIEERRIKKLNRESLKKLIENQQ